MKIPSALFYLILAGLFIALWFAIAKWLGSFMIRRAIREVIKIFREERALDIISAKTVKELDLMPRLFYERLFFYNNLSTKDWKPGALNLLRQAGVVQSTQEERLYLSEAILRESHYAHIND
jgi:hypothetical protein